MLMRVPLLSVNIFQDLTKCFLTHLHNAGMGSILNPHVKRARERFLWLWTIFKYKPRLLKKVRYPLSSFNPGLSLSEICHILPHTTSSPRVNFSAGRG